MTRFSTSFAPLSTGGCNCSSPPTPALCEIMNPELVSSVEYPGLGPTWRTGGDVQGGFLSPGSFGDWAACDLCEVGWEGNCRGSKKEQGKAGLNIRTA